jgi:hypothetical protein
MYSLVKFPSRTGRLGTPLPTPFTVFDFENVKFRHGATSLLAGKPGAGKSIFALNLLVKWAQAGEPIYYFSADSDEYTVARRLGGIIGGYSMDKIELMNQRDLAAVIDVPYLEHTRFEYRVSRSEDAVEFIAERLSSYEAVYGAYPSIVFVDNLINYAPSATDWGAMIDLLVELDCLSRETMSHICVLHHASRGYGHSSDPVPAEAIQGKVDQIPRLVLTMAANANLRAVVCTKNTNGPQYPEADRWMTFEVQPSLQVTDRYQEMM